MTLPVEGPPGSSPPGPRARGGYRLGFAMEQNLGHRTHYRNLVRYVAEDLEVSPAWVPIEFEPPGRLYRLPGLRSNLSARASIYAFRAFRRLLREGPVDTFFYHTQVTALLSPLLARVPTVVSLDATPVNYDSVGEFYGHASGGPLEGLKWRLNRSSFRRAAALVAWCRWARDSLVADYGIDAGKISIIPPGVDLDLWPRPSVAARIEARRGRVPRLLFVGGDFARKGGEVLLEAFRRGLDERCELHVVTQSRLPPARNLHVYNGITPNSEVLVRLYAEADIFVFPSLADCAPLAVPEAMGAAIPVVSTRVGAIPEMVSDGETGLLVPVRDAAALAVAIATLLDRPDLRARMGEAGRRRVEAEYDARVNARKLLEILKGAARRTPAARVDHS
jgi:glycosyltransferase involved in cell wall biosynthesis